jgi:hypothetical protein
MLWDLGRQRGRTPSVHREASRIGARAIRDARLQPATEPKPRCRKTTRLGCQRRYQSAFAQSRPGLRCPQQRQPEKRSWLQCPATGRRDQPLPSAELRLARPPCSGNREFVSANWPRRDDRWEVAVPWVAMREGATRQVVDRAERVPEAPRTLERPRQLPTLAVARVIARCDARPSRSPRRPTPLPTEAPPAPLPE